MPPTEPTLESGARPEVSGASHPAAEPASAPLTPADDAEAVLILRTALAGTLADLLRTKRAILGALGRRKLVASQQAHADRR